MRRIHFDNLLDLEEHLSAVVDGVVLFLESAGSICELGVFTKIDEIREKLLVFLMNDHADHQSFITLGPLKYLKGDDAARPQVIKYHWEMNGNVATIPDYVLPGMVNHSTQHALSRYGLRELLDVNVKGHFILSVLAVSFLLRGGLLSEIKDCMSILRPGTKQTEILKALDVLHILGLIKPVSNGPRKRHFVPQTSRINVDVKLSPEFSPRDPLRSLAEIAQVIKSDDPIRASIFIEHNHAA